MSRDRITQIRIRGLRVIEDITLDLTGLTVLIGDNGAGKSTLLEALELLRLAAQPGYRWVSDVLIRHFGGIQSIIRYGASELSLGVTIESETEPKLEYELAVAIVGNSASVVAEKLDLHLEPGAKEPLHVLIRDVKRGTKVFDLQTRKLRPWWAGELDSQTLAISAFGTLVQPAFSRLLAALSNIEYHPAFDTRPLWQQRELDVRAGPRWPSELSTAPSVARYGQNLPSCYQELRNRGGETWERVLYRARIALGHDLRDFVLTPAGRGTIELEAKFAGLPHNVPVHAMSEGQLSFLLLVAATELDVARPILVIDEPEVHLHPSLLVNALYMLESAASSCPVLLATHSDRLLDALEDPVKSVVLCELDEHRALRLLRPDQRKLDLWLESYRGLGSLRAEGYDFAVFDPDRLAQGNKQ